MRSLFNPSQKHKASLEAQNRITEERIESTHNTIDSLSSIVTCAVETFKESASAITVSIDYLHQASEQMSATSNKVADSTLLIQKGLEQLVEEAPLFNQVAEETHANTLKTVEVFNGLTDLLDETKLKLDQAHYEIQILNSTVDKQSNAITHLGKVVVEQKKTIDILNEEKNILSNIAKKSVYNCNILKQYLQKDPQILAEREHSVKAI